MKMGAIVEDCSSAGRLNEKMSLGRINIGGGFADTLESDMGVFSGTNCKRQFIFLKMMGFLLLSYFKETAQIASSQRIVTDIDDCLAEIGSLILTSLKPGREPIMV